MQRGSFHPHGASNQPPALPIAPCNPTTAQSSRLPPSGESLGSPGAQLTKVESHPSMAHLGQPTAVPWSVGDWKAPIHVGVLPTRPARKAFSSAVPMQGSEALWCSSQCSAQWAWLPDSRVNR